MIQIKLFINQMTEERRFKQFTAHTFKNSCAWFGLKMTIIKNIRNEGRQRNMCTRGRQERDVDIIYSLPKPEIIQLSDYKMFLNEYGDVLTLKYILH